MDHGSGTGGERPAADDDAISPESGVGADRNRAPAGGITPARRLPFLKSAAAPLNAASLLAALLGGLGYLALACLSLMFTDRGTAVSPIWLPNACAVVFLLRARLTHEWPFLAAAFLASVGANLVNQVPDHAALLFSLANIAQVVAVLCLIRQGGRSCPDMTRLPDLARFVWAGGLIGPLVSALVIGPAAGGSLAEMQRGMVGWFLTNSTAMVLIVPTTLLLLERLERPIPMDPAYRIEAVALLIGGVTCTFLVFLQPHDPLMFLIPPITLLHAFRLGSLGTALHVGAAALMAAAMSWAGFGPIAASTGAGLTQLHLLQAFIAANFLTGLPVAAILAGRDRMMAELEAGKQQVELLADNITDAVLRFNLDGACTYASPSVEEVMGLPPDALLNQPLGTPVHPDTRSRVVEALRRLLIGESEKERITFRRFLDDDDGGPVFLEADGAIIRDPITGAREGVVVSARDVTERIELELLLTRAHRHAENAAQAKSDFLANMSHEIRTPMNGVLGFAELILQADLPPDQRRYAEMIVQSGRSMMLLLNDVLDLSKIESGQFAIDLAPVDLYASLEECTALHRPAAQSKGLGLTFSSDGDDDHMRRCDTEGSAWVMTDGLRLRQIMLNLIGNAVKFTQAGDINVSFRLTGHGVQIVVADSGMGIAADKLDEIFQPFTQGDAETMRRFGGTGLGLSISRQLAGLLGGQITVESTPGVGSRFTLSLPGALVSPATGSEPEEPPPPPAVLPAHARILLVDDHDINRLLVSEMLERCGQDVAIAHDGNEGIAMVIDSIMRGRPYDLVLMDLQMPDCDGYEATRAIRAEGIGPDLLPIIALTANAFPEDIAAARAAGMQAHLAKPMVLADLARALQRWLPTRIIEAVPEQRPTRLSAMAHSPGLVARWQQRRREALDAVIAALAAGSLEDAGDHAADDPRPAPLAMLVHKLAGSAAMFGERELGDAAAALDRALRHTASAGERAALAQALLAIGDETAPDSADHSATTASARG